MPAFLIFTLDDAPNIIDGRSCLVGYHQPYSNKHYGTSPSVLAPRVLASARIPQKIPLFDITHSSLQDKIVEKIKFMMDIDMFTIKNDNLSSSTSLINTTPTTHSRISHQAVTSPLTTEDYNAIWSAWDKNSPPGERESRDIAVARMHDCLERKSISLDLSYLGLSLLPAVMPEQITELDVSHNRLHILPEQLPAHLKKLLANGNSLTALPNKLPQEIFELNLSFNNLQSFPEDLPASISNLDISDNKIEGPLNNLPKSLNYLDLSYNELETIPDELPEHINYLDLSDNNIKRMPDKLPNFILHLDLSDNQLNKFPNHLPNSIQYLNLNDNNIKTLPTSIAKMPATTEIYITNNPLSNTSILTLSAIIKKNNTGPQIIRFYPSS